MNAADSLGRCSCCRFYDALKIIAFDGALVQNLIGEMRFMNALANTDKTVQALIVACRE